MSQKRKGKSLLEKVAKLAKASQESEKFDEEKSQYFKQMESAFERQNETESKDAFFSRVYNDSSPLDRVLEFLIFKREAEKLLPELRDELVALVALNECVTFLCFFLGCPGCLGCSGCLCP